MPQTDAQRAKELIKAEKFDEARKLLRKYPESPLAQRWLAKLDEIAPEKKPMSKWWLIGAIAVLIFAVAFFVVSLQPDQDEVDRLNLEARLDRWCRDVNAGLDVREYCDGFGEGYAGSRAAMACHHLYPDRDNAFKECCYDEGIAPLRF